MKILNKEITVLAHKKFPSKFEGVCLNLHIKIGENEHVVFTSSKPLIEMIDQVPPNKYPFQTTIVRDGERYIFT